jgi:hypothetical protein
VCRFVASITFLCIASVALAGEDTGTIAHSTEHRLSRGSMDTQIDVHYHSEVHQDATHHMVLDGASTLNLKVQLDAPYNVTGSGTMDYRYRGTAAYCTWDTPNVLGVKISGRLEADLLVLSWEDTFGPFRSMMRCISPVPYAFPSFDSDTAVYPGSAARTVTLPFVHQKETTVQGPADGGVGFQMGSSNSATFTLRLGCDFRRDSTKRPIVEFVDVPPHVDHSKTMGQIKADSVQFRDLPADTRVVGLTYPGGDKGGGARFDPDPPAHATARVGRGVCIWIEKVSVAWPFFTIEIASEYRTDKGIGKDNCEYRAVMVHELEHLNLYAAAFGRYRDQIRSEFRAALDGARLPTEESPLVADSVEDGRKRLIEDLSALVDPVIKKYTELVMTPEERQKQNALDTKQGYKKMTDTCPNGKWL